MNCDLIFRSVVVAGIDSDIEWLGKNGCPNEVIEGLNRARRIVEFAPAVEDLPPDDVHLPTYANWSDKMVTVCHGFDDFTFGFKCSNCGGVYNRTPFCGGCGFPMKWRGENLVKESKE